MPMVLARKAQLDNYRWYLKTMLPREYGDQPLLVNNSATVHVYLPAKDQLPDDDYIEGNVQRALDAPER